MVSCPPGLHRLGWGVPPAKSLFGMQLYVQQRAGHPERRGDSPRQVMAGLSEHSETQSYGLGVPPEPSIPQAVGTACSFVPDCPGCWGHLCFRESSVTPWKLLTGMGLEGRTWQVSSSVAFHWRTKSALGTFTQPHSISREVGAGLSLQWDRDKDRRQAQGHLLGEPAPDSLVLLVLLDMSWAQLGHMPVMCFWGQGRACVLWREEVPARGSAIALRVRIRLVWPVPATTGALWLVGHRELCEQGLVGGTETPCQHRQVQGWQGHSQPSVREELPASHLCWGCFSQ